MAEQHPQQRAMCLRYQQLVVDDGGQQRVTFSCECAGADCPFGPGMDPRSSRLASTRTRVECLAAAGALEGALHMVDDDQAAENLAYLADQWRAEAVYALGDAPDEWDGDAPPGGFVCGVCGMPVESEPCADHQPEAAARVHGPS